MDPSQVPQEITSTAQPTQTAGATTDHDPGHGLGIASLVTSLMGMSLIGLILGIVAKSKSKSVGRSNGMALAGIIISVISMVLALLSVVLFIVLARLANSSIDKNLTTYSSIEDSSLGESDNSAQTSAADEMACLKESDFASYELSGVYGDYNAALASFNPDLTTFASKPFDDDGRFFVSNTLTKYNQLKDKDFSVLLTGGVNKGSNTQAARDLANARAEAVASELVAVGIPKSRIVIGETTDSSNNDFAVVDEWNRTVKVDFTLDCR